MSRLILVRHGQSKWNLANKFTGWIDVSISEKGIKQCLYLAEKLKKLKIDYTFSSELSRAKETMSVILSKQKNSGVYIHEENPKYNWADIVKYPSKIPNIAIYTTENLNERNYGSLQGMDKAEARKKYGEEQVFNWRRGFAHRPPKGESLEDVYNRTVPFLKKRIIPLLNHDKNIIISAHGNSLRSIIKYIENISDEKIPQLEIYTGQLITYHFKDNQFVSQLDKLSFNRPIAWKKIKKYLKPKHIFNSIIKK